MGRSCKNGQLGVIVKKNFSLTMEFSTFVSKKDIYASLIAWIKLSQKLSKSLIRLEKREESFI